MKQLNPSPKVHFKMYKGGKFWLISGISLATLAGTIAVSEATVHADTSSANPNSQAVQNGGNAVTKTNASYTQVNVDSSALMSAATAAQSAGVAVSSAAAGTTYNVQGSAQLASAEAAVQNDYANQTQNLQDKAKLAQASNAAQSAVDSANAQVNSAVAAYQAAGGAVQKNAVKKINVGDDPQQAMSLANSQASSIRTSASSATALIKQATDAKAATDAGHSQIQAAVNEAKTVPGLTLVQGSNKVVSNSDDANSDTAAVLKQIQNAIAQQKRNNSDYQSNLADWQSKKSTWDAEYAKYQKELNEWKSKNPLNSNGVSSSEISQGLHYVSEPNAKINVSSQYKVSPNGNDQYWIEGFKFNQSGVIATVTYTNLTNSTYLDSLGIKHKIGKVVYTYSNPEATGNLISKMHNAISVYTDPIKNLVYSGTGITQKIEFYDETGNMIDFANTSSYLNPMSLNSWTAKYWNDSGIFGGVISEGVEVVNGGQSYALLGSSDSLHSNGKIYSDNDDSYKSEGSLYESKDWDYDGSPYQYYGAALVKLTGTSLTLHWFYNFQNDDAYKAYFGTDSTGKYNPSAVKDNNKMSAWAEVTTVIPQTPGPTPPSVPNPGPKPTLTTTSANYNFTTTRWDGVPIPYTLYENTTPRPTATVHTDVINYGQTGTKDSTEVIGGSTTTIDGRRVVKGDTLHYAISTDNLPAHRTADIKTVELKDTLPTGTGLKSAKVMLGNQDVTSMFSKTISGQTVDFVLKGGSLLQQMNANKGQEFAMPKLLIDAIVTADGASLKNTATVLINDNQATTNTTVSTTGTSNPTKSATVDNDTADANGKWVVPGDKINYTVTWDLSGLPANTAVSDDLIKQGLTLTDDYDAQTTADQKSLTITDNGKAVAGVNVSWNGHQLALKANDVKTFLQNYGGKKLTVKFNATVNPTLKDGSVINNTAVQNNFGQNYPTNTVTEKITKPDPKKDVVANAGSTVSLNGETVPFGSNFDYKLNPTQLQANRATVVTNWSATDVLDLAHVTPTGQWLVQTDTPITIDGTNYVAGSDVSQYFTHVYDAKTGTVRLIPNAKYLAAVNAQKGSAQHWTGYVQTKVTKAGWATNQFTEGLNTNQTDSNVVKTFSYDPVNPDANKDASIGKNSDSATSINGKHVTKGDTISFELKGQPLTQYHDPINNFAVQDIFDKGLTYIGYIGFLKNADGTKTDVTSHLKEQVDGNTVKWVADDYLKGLMNPDKYNTKAGVTPTIIAYAVVNTDNPAEKIDNTYNLLINGKTDVSNIVEVTPAKDNPTKSETVSGNNADGKTIMANDQVNYDVVWDLSGLDPMQTVVSDAQMAKGMSLTDTMTATEGTLAAPVSAKDFILKDASGKAVNSNLYTLSNPTTATKDGVVTTTVKLAVKDVKAFLQAYGGQKLHLTYTVKVKDGKSGNVSNQATQTDFGNTYTTNVVKNVITDINPTKDVVVNAGDNVSIDGKTVAKNSTLNYRLNSSELPANRASIVGTWSATDHLDLTHVKPTGQWKVFTDYDFVDAQGKTVKAGTDITAYFTHTYQNGMVTVTPNDAFKALMNSAANRNTKQKWSAYEQVQVVTAGWAKNTFSEDLNNIVDNSNEVKTFSFDPVTPDANKDVKIGQTSDDKAGSVNGKHVTKGDTVSYELKGQPLTQYHEKIKDFAATDTLSDGLSYEGYKAQMVVNGQLTDVTAHLQLQKNGNTLKWTADDYLKGLMNPDAYNTKAGVTPTIFVYAKVAKDDTTIKNTYELSINGKTDVSNIVETKTQGSKPEKTVNIDGTTNGNGKAILANDRLDYTVTWDLSNLDLKQTAISQDQLAKGLTLTDTMKYAAGAITQPKASDFKLVDKNGQAVAGNLYQLTIGQATTKDGQTTLPIVVKVTDTAKFLQTYGGQKLFLKSTVTALKDKAGSITNQATQTNFGQSYQTTVVENHLANPKPTKDVVKNAGDTVSIDGKTVKMGDTINYVLNSRVLPANRGTVVGDWSVSDILSKKVAATGQWKAVTLNDITLADGSVIKAGADISQYFTVKIANGMVEATPNAELLKLANMAANQAHEFGWRVYVPTTVVAAGWATNQFNEDLNKVDEKSNEVKTFTFDPVKPDPKKDVNLGHDTADNADQAASINGDLVTVGDILTYQLKGQPLVQYHEAVKDFTAVDIFDPAVSYLGFAAYLHDQAGQKVDVTKHLTAKVVGNQVTWVADSYLTNLMNPDEYNTVAGETPTILAYVKVQKPAALIKNTYTLTFNGQNVISNEVKNSTPEEAKPGKVNTIDGVNIDGKLVQAGSTSHYQLTWDLDQYKGAVASTDQIKHGFFMVDDYPDAVLVPDLAKVTVKAGDQAVEGVSVHEYQSLQDAPAEVQAAFKAQGISPDGAFIVFSVDDPAQFFKDYVQTGKSLTIDLPAAVKQTTAPKTSFTNKAYQSDFGNLTVATPVTNETPEVPKPTKTDANTAGVDINGKTVLPGSTNVYKLTMDFDQYKGLVASDDVIANGFYVIDDYPEEALTADPSQFTIQDTKGQAVKGMSVKLYKSVADAPAQLQAVIKANKLNLKGAFVVFSADDPAQFFKDYVQTGDSITLMAPMTVKDDLANGASYSNVAYQIDFGQAYETNTVTNNVTKPDPKKDVVLSVDNQQSLSGSTIKLNQAFDYELAGANLPEGLGTPLTQYGFIDDYDQTHDQYNGQYIVLAMTDVHLTDGTVLKKGTDLSKYTTQHVDTDNGKLDIEFDKDFLAKVDFTRGGFAANAYVSMTRIKAGDVENKYDNVINGKDYLSNTVTTHTEEPPAPVTPTTPTQPTTPVTPSTPAAPAPEATPVLATPNKAATPTPAPAAVLPQTGNNQSKAAMLLGLAGALASFGLLGGRKKRHG